MARRWVSRLVAVALGVPLLAELFIGGRSAVRVLRTLKPARVHVTLDPHALPTPYDDVSFRTSDGLLIKGWYHASHNGAIVALLHGLRGNREQMLPQANILTDAGFGVLLFDWRGQGESEGNGITWGADEQRDLVAALGWLDAEHPGSRIGGLGFSMGGIALVEVAARHPEIRAVVTEGTYPSMKAIAFQLESANGVLSGYPAIASMRLFGPSFDAVRPEDHLRELAPRPLFLIYGSNEPCVGYDLPQRMLKAACPVGATPTADGCGPAVRFWVVPGAEHGKYVDVAPAEVRARLTAFFDEALLAPAGPSSALAGSPAQPRPSSL